MKETGPFGDGPGSRQDAYDHVPFSRSPSLTQLISPAGPIVGTAITLPDRCRCGGNLAQIDPRALHQFVLRCRGCSRPRGVLERAAASFITEIIKRFGVPTQPITLRQRDNTRDGTPPAAPAPSLAVEQRS
jgi:hypothetical protein